MFDKKSSSISINNEGNGNVYNITQVNVGDNGDLSAQLKFLGADIVKEAGIAIGGKLVSDSSNVLLCYPNKEDKYLEPIIIKIKDKLSNMGATIFEGSGKIQLPDVQGYPHIAEIDFIKNLRCDSIIIFVLDELTLSQLTLLSYYKIEFNLQSVDIIAIPSDNIFYYDKFLSKGLIQYCDDNNCKVIKLSMLDDEQIDSLIDRVRNKKIIQIRRG
ncbi:hypothetical protein [Proteus terrae]|uniref:hypothetical protein n=1 Tax=Proteus terrae TaxID=1574161 RepID=UPI003525AA62